MNNKSHDLERLKELLASLPKEDIYRSVYTPDGKLLAQGVEPLKQQLIDDFKKVDFTDKEVVDLGCSFGYFTFLALECGAKHVTGVDALPAIVESAELLARMRNVSDCNFVTYNFEESTEKLGKFDMVMLVDFFGKSNIRKCKVKPIIEFMTSIAKKELLFAIRPINRIENDLKMTEESFSPLYPAHFVRDGSFYLLEYIESLLGESWKIEAVSPYDGAFCKHKLLFGCKKIIS